MLEAVLLVASDRVVDAIEPIRQSEETMLAEYEAEQARAGERKATSRKAPKPAGLAVARAQRGAA